MGLEPQIVAEVDDMAMIRLLTRAGAGLAVAPQILMRDELESRQLDELAQLPGLKESFDAITAKRRFTNPLIGGLIRGWRRAMRSGDAESVGPNAGELAGAPPARSPPEK